MEPNKIFDKLETLYKKDEKSKNFVLHLVRAYLPLDKVDKVWEKPADLSKFKCALTNDKLISVAEIFEGMQTDEFKENFIKDLKIQVKSDGELAEPAILKITKGRILGWTGKDTNTFLCQDAVGQLFNWVSTKVLQGDGKINWTIRSMQGKEFLKKFDNDKSSETRKQVSRVKQVINKPATAKLGDMDVLQSLKDKLAAQEKKK
jgi:hypothetical protein